MSVKKIKGTTTKVVFEVAIELDSQSMLKSEEAIQAKVNELGRLASLEALKQFDTDGRAIEMDGEVLTQKAFEKKNTKHLMAK